MVIVKDFFNDIDSIFSFQAEEKNLKFGVNLDPNVPESIHTDPKRLKQVVLNLISNSFKFTQMGKIEINLRIERGMVTASSSMIDRSENTDGAHESAVLFEHVKFIKNGVTEEHDVDDSLKQNLMMTQRFKQRKYLVIDVIDTGFGITENDKKELFTKFATGNNDQNLNTNGLGLGLYLSQEICRRLDG